MDLKTIHSVIRQLAEEKGVSPEKVLEVVEAALAAAYKKEYRKKSEIVKCKFDENSGKLNFWLVKTVVDPSEVRVVEEGEEEEEKKPAQPTEEEGERPPRYNSDRHIFLEEAKKKKSDCSPGDEVDFPLEAHEEFGRIAAQTAKQVILQNLREAERESIEKEFAGKENSIVSGVVQRIERGNIFIDLGRAIGVMFKMESVPGEYYKIGDRLRFYLLAVQKEEARRPGIILSRSHPDFVQKLFEMEVPEIADGTVEIKAIARESGSRTKIAVYSTEDGVDPVGSTVGQRGTRVMAVTNELGNEKIDIIEWSDDPSKFISNALSPAKTKAVEVLPRRSSKVFVAEDQLSLAIGKGGQNVRLAARLTGWKIDVRSQERPEEVQEGGVAHAENEVKPEKTPESEEKESQEEVLEKKEE